MTFIQGQDTCGSCNICLTDFEDGENLRFVKTRFGPMKTPYSCHMGRNFSLNVVFLRSAPGFRSVESKNCYLDSRVKFRARGAPADRERIALIDCSRFYGSYKTYFPNFKFMLDPISRNLPISHNLYISGPCHVFTASTVSVLTTGSHEALSVQCAVQ